jgi:hypothetical protein
MSQPVYPTLSISPVRSGFEKSAAFDPTIRTQLEDGAYLVTGKVTRVPYFWRFRYRFLSDTDRETLMEFYTDDSTFGAVPIKWTDPTNSTAYFVHFAGQPECVIEEGEVDLWNVSVSFIEAIGTYT